MKKIILLSVLVFYFFCFHFKTYSQSYKSAIGGIWGGNVASGVSFKHFLNTGMDKNNNGFEIIALSFYEGILAYGLYERQSHIIIGNANSGLSYYYGLGGHFGNFKPTANYCKTDPLGRYTKIGIDGIIGVEYELDHLFTHHNVPFVISADVKPFYDFVGQGCGGIWTFGVSIRYILGGFSLK